MFPLTHVASTIFQFIFLFPTYINEKQKKYLKISTKCHDIYSNYCGESLWGMRRVFLYVLF